MVVVKTLCVFLMAATASNSSRPSLSVPYLTLVVLGCGYTAGPAAQIDEIGTEAMSGQNWGSHGNKLKSIGSGGRIGSQGLAFLACRVIQMAWVCVFALCSKWCCASGRARENVLTGLATQPNLEPRSDNLGSDFLHSGLATCTTVVSLPQWKKLTTRFPSFFSFCPRVALALSVFDEQRLRLSLYLVYCICGGQTKVPLPIRLRSWVMVSVEGVSGWGESGAKNP